MLRARGRGLIPTGGSPVKFLGEHDIGKVNGAFALDGRALAMLLAFSRVPLDQHDPFDNHPPLAAQDADNPPALAALGAGDDDDLIPFFDVAFKHTQITSGASETIFINFLSRSSRATGPKIRV